MYRRKQYQGTLDIFPLIIGQTFPAPVPPHPIKNFANVKIEHTVCEMLHILNKYVCDRGVSLSEVPPIVTTPKTSCSLDV